MIENIRDKVHDELFEISNHALTRSTQRYILLDEIVEAILAGEIIEDYPDDRYGPSCLIAGYTKKQRPLHIQCSYPSRPLLKIITVYEPTLDKWEANLKVRKR
ncbi:DUF4258 domain-containing protein [Spirosoma foliorum]|uniref:DUF4258 domain-containing protein n=1 Tax=Spirosoma foliorum TaxID=2710596 RepID=A0A7G5H4M6_9BACT|nr:DUF4258 domain-containing protein [Spirosoma foliorum]